MLEMSAQILETLLLIRKVDEKLIELYPTDKIKSPVHLSIGQEGAAIAALPLSKEDAVFGSYRSHALYVAKGGDLKRFFAEMMGKATGCCGGKGGSMHICDPEAGVMGTSAIVASTIPVAVGWAYANKLKKKNNVALVFLGDGATDEGTFYESINFAVSRSAPVIFLCENNRYAIHSHIKDRSRVSNISERIKGMDILSIQGSSLDPEDLYNGIQGYVEGVREEIFGIGPLFVEVDTYRLYEHVGIKTDWHKGYRKESEARKWIENDPLRLFDSKELPMWLEVMKQRVENKIEEAVKFAEESPFPEKVELYKDLW